MYFTWVFGIPNSADEGARRRRLDESFTSSNSEKEVCVLCVCVWLWLRTCVCVRVRVCMCVSACMYAYVCVFVGVVQLCIQNACSHVSKLMQPRCLTCLTASDVLLNWYNWFDLFVAWSRSIHTHDVMLRHASPEEALLVVGIKTLLAKVVSQWATLIFDSIRRMQFSFCPQKQCFQVPTRELASTLADYLEEYANCRPL